MRTAKISTLVSIKINTGNYETLEVSKSIETEVTFDKPEELTEKSKGLDRTAASMLKDEAEYICTQLGRRRVVKVGSKETPVGLFELI
jgi:hypothetical protein